MAEVIDAVADPAQYRDGMPHELFTELRRAGAVHRTVPMADDASRVDGAPYSFWSVVRHAEIQHVNRDWETFSAHQGAQIRPTQPERQGTMIVSMDPPDHTRLRRLISSGFTPRMIAELEGAIVRRTRQVLDEAAARGDCDFVVDVAYQLPMHVIADIVGIPDADRQMVFHNAELMLRGQDPASGLSAEERAGAERELFLYASALGASKRERPTDDVWTILSGTELGELELDLFFLVLTLAGSETTRNAISQGLVALLDHPEQLGRLRGDPALLGPATDEMIRWASPVLYFGRVATRDVELGGQQIRAGDRVVMWYPSGNRDEAVFDDPFRFDIARQPNPHVSFGGGGPHYCLGASLAKKEVQVMMAALLERFDVERTGPARWSGSGPTHNVGVSIDHLPVRLTPRAAAR
jgi:cytochrome P450